VLHWPLLQPTDMQVPSLSLSLIVKIGPKAVILIFLVHLLKVEVRYVIWGGGGIRTWYMDWARFLIVAAVSGPTRSCDQHRQRVRPTAAAAGLEPRPDGRGHRVVDQPQQQIYLQQHIRVMIWKVERQAGRKNDIKASASIERFIWRSRSGKKCRLH
jgi:hypothetical protein